MCELKRGRFESDFSKYYHGDRAMERYERIRMAVFSPEYLISHTNWDDSDFTALIDEIVRQQTEVIRLKQIISEAGELSTGWKHGNKGLHLLKIQSVLSGNAK